MYSFYSIDLWSFYGRLHAATAAPTWPKINGQWFPDVMNRLTPGWKNFLDNRITVQFIHRGLAYILLIAVIFWNIKAGKLKQTPLFNKTKRIPLILIFFQVILGILTVILSTYMAIIWYGLALPIN